MAIAAHRYCLGRMTYIVGACIEWLRRWWPQLDAQTRNVIVRDTIEALQDGCAGAEMDVADWRAFAGWAWAQMDDEARTWCRGAVAHRNKPWPLAPEQEAKP